MKKARICVAIVQAIAAMLLIAAVSACGKNTRFYQVPPLEGKQGKAGEVIALAGSIGLIELAINRGNAAKRLKVSRGATVEIERQP